jgi:hypothetical protein
MKRQHPDNPDLFWCPKCKTYKPLTVEHWYKRSDSITGFRGCCKNCLDEMHKKYVKEHRVGIKLYLSRYATDHQPQIKCAQGKYLTNHPGRRKSSVNNYAKNHYKENLARSKKGRADLQDWYVRYVLKKYGIDNISPELIELKRQQIIMIRTLKQFKAWRNEHESNNTDVQREQRENEEADGRQGHTQP